MKNILSAKAVWVLLLCLMIPPFVNAQTEIITFPVDGSIFQKNASEQHKLYIAGQLQNTNPMFYRVEMRSGSSWTNVTTDNQLSTTWSVGDRKGFYVNVGNLSKGWYRVRLYRKYKVWLFINKRVYKDSKSFGVGDIYFVAGQSNAQGYLGDGGNQDDGPIVPFLSSNQNESARVYKISDNGNDISKGLPYFKPDAGVVNRFDIFENGIFSNIPTQSKGIYPNGVASWCWSSLAKKISDGGTPVMFFNVASGGSSVNQDWAASQTSTLMTKFSSTLKMYGNVLGAKAVLWHQGERDSQILSLSSTDQTSYLNNYAVGLNSLITWSRQTLKDENNKNLSWFVSKVSYTTGDNVNGGFGIGTQRTQPPFSFVTNCLPQTGYQKEKNSALIAKQNSLISSTNRVYLGVDSDNFSPTPECDRAAAWRIHFTGPSLETLATKWKEAIDNANASNSISSTELIKLDAVSGGSGSYTLTVANQGSGSIYHWVKNDAGINSATSTTTNSYTFNSVSTDDFLGCYVTKPDGRLAACQPFIVPGGTFDQQSLAVTNNNLSFIANGENKETTVIAKNTDWDLMSVPSWVTADINDEEGKVIFTASANNTSSNRVGTAVIQQVGGGVSTSVNFTQSATSGCTQTNLSSLTPSSESFSYTGKRNNLNISGQTMMVGGYQTNNGIGTHANSRLVYNLNGQYSTFSGSVGRDDAADNCGCGTMKLQFIIKADGATLFTSNLLGTADGKQAFSVNVAGKNNVELIVNDGGDQPWGDHADWLDAILYCGTPPTCTTAPPVPTNVNSSPQTISSGVNSTLSATCATGVVVWNTGQTANSITVSPTITTSYNAKCVSGSCPASNTVSVGVTVNSSGCSGFANGTVMGTWTVTGQPLVARFFHGQYWLTQRAGTNPDVFVVRGSGMLQRSDVSLSNGSYYNMVNCFAWTYSDYGSLQNPPSTTFPTPSGYSLSYSQDGTMIYTANSGGGSGSGCTDTYVSNNWASATIGDGSGPKIGQNYQGGTMNINGTAYSQGIGTHAGSEIVYNLGSHSYANFKASVGRDVSSYSCNCGGQTIVFKVYNHSTGALIGSSTNNPVTKTINQSASDMVVPISGVSSIRLVVEDGGDQIWGDWANWGKARFTCAGSNFREAAITPEEWFWVSPNPNDGKFIAKVNLKIPQSVQLYLSDIKGNIIKEYSFKGIEGMNNFEINIQDKITIESIYNIRCQAGEVSDSKRVIVEK